MVKSSRSQRIMMSGLVAFGVVLACPAPASAQLDPLLFLKASPPNVIVAVDVGNRMQRDAPTDALNPLATSNYYDPFIYTKQNIAQEVQLGVTTANTSTFYRRKYIGLAYTNSGNADKFTAQTITPTGDLTASFASFEAPTRLAIARAAIDQAIRQNQIVARFGLIKMRQGANLAIATQGNSGPVANADPNQTVGDLSGVGKWSISRPTVTSNNGAATTSGLLVQADAVNANTTVLTTLAKDTRTAGGVLPAGGDDANAVDTPVTRMLDDARTEAVRLIAADTLCRNTIVVLIVGGGEGTTTPGADPTVTASTFLNVSSRRVPIYVIAIAPPASNVTQLQNIALNSGGQYFEIAKSVIDAALASPPTSPITPLTGTVIVPEVVRAINIAVQHAFATFADFNTAPSIGLPYGPQSEFQVTSPTVGTVNLENASDITGALLPNTIVNDKAGTKIPQRGNLLITTGFALPSFDGKLRAFRVYKPVLDNTTPSGYKFSSDGTRLWVASTPAAASRNIYTVRPDGTMTAFTTANVAVLAPYMNLSETDATSLISSIRSLPLGAFVGSTPAIMDPPSVDPPPDLHYPGFAGANTNRRSIIWIGGNDGMLHGIDARLGVEVWAFIPFNLLPKLKALRDGQAVGAFDYFVDSSPKIADVRMSAPCGRDETSCWRTYLFFGQGPGGTFYQAFDVTMSDMDAAVTQTSDTIGQVLAYFADPTKVTFKWAFPNYTQFDTTFAPYGDLLATASNIDKSVGQTWSDPAVGQIESSTGKFALITGSGFLPYSQQVQFNRGGIVAGLTLYLLNVETGAVYDSSAVTSDGKGETVDDCAAPAVNDCTELKDALQADPVATGPPDSRFITKVYIGDLAGRVWRFDVGMNATTSLPFFKVKPPLELFKASSGSGSASTHPIFSSMATVNVGSTQQYIFFATGSDLLPRKGPTVAYMMIGVLDQGTSGAQTFSRQLAPNERVTSFPAVAGDIVFFTTTTFDPAVPCTPPNANLYAFTFIGGAAYDATGDNTVSGGETPLVKTVTGARATAPFIVDQHVAFGAGGKVELFGDPADYNNGVGQVGIRILSWRDVR